MLYVLELNFPVDLNTANEILRMNRFKRNRIFKKIYSDVYYMVLQKGRPDNLVIKCHLTFIHYTHRKQDPDNFVTSLKPYIDALKAKYAKVIVDDSYEVIQSLKTEQINIKKAEKERLYIKVEQIL